MRFFSASSAASRISSTTSPVRWGIVSAGKISSDFTKALSISKGAEAAAIAARSGEKAKEFAAQHGIRKSYGSYDSLFNDPDIDVVYVGSVADQHFHLALSALQAGKPTVVEKPLTLSLADTKELVGLARKTNTFLMEGMWTRCFPAMRKVRDIVASGDIGEVACVQGDFGWSTEGCPVPQDRIWSSDSGGMTLDIGMYMAQLGQVAFPYADVEAVHAMGSLKHGVDHTVMANIMYDRSDANGWSSVGKGMLQFYVTGEANTEERVVLQGTKGRVVIDPPAHVPEKVRVFYDEGRGIAREDTFDFPLPDDSFESWNYPGSVGFMHQIEEVGAALRDGEKECRHFTLDDSVQVASILDEILAQVKRKENESSFGADGHPVEASAN